MKSTIKSQVMKLANQIHKHNPSEGRSKATKIAWSIVKSGNFEFVRFQKKDGTVSERFIDRNWTAYQSTKKSGRTAPDGLVVCADLAKVNAGKYPIISFYTDKKVA
jgi:hypothetical protein